MPIKYTGKVAFPPEERDTQWGSKVKVKVTPHDQNAPKQDERGHLQIWKNLDHAQAPYIWSLTPGQEVELMWNENNGKGYYEFVEPAGWQQESGGTTVYGTGSQATPRQTQTTRNPQPPQPEVPFGVAMEALLPQVTNIYTPYLDSAKKMIAELELEPTAEAVSSIAATLFIRAGHLYDRGKHNIVVTAMEEPEDENEFSLAPEMLDKFQKLTSAAARASKPDAAKLVAQAIADILDEDVQDIGSVLNEFGFHYENFEINPGLWEEMLSVCHMYQSLATSGLSEGEIGDTVAKMHPRARYDKPPF